MRRISATSLQELNVQLLGYAAFYRNSVLQDHTLSNGPVAVLRFVLFSFVACLPTRRRLSLTIAI
jgi:hypothetical protein